MRRERCERWGRNSRRRLSVPLARSIFDILVRVFSWTDRSSLHKLEVYYDYFIDNRELEESGMRWSANVITGSAG